MSHHDPAIQDESNRTLFNRQKQLLARTVTTTLPSQEQVDNITALHLVPAAIADIFAGIAFPEFVATALVRVYIDMYNGFNGGEGAGLFSGMERYARLEARLRQAAICSPTLRSWWDRLCDATQVPIHAGDADLTLLRLLAVPAGLQQLVLRVLVADYRSVVAVARAWHQAVKDQSVEYRTAKLARARGLKSIDGGANLPAALLAEASAGVNVEFEELDFDVAAIPVGSDRAEVVEVPTVTGNSLRHQVVREPAFMHLMGALGLAEARPGEGPVPPGVEAMLYNGGNIEAGAKQPSNVFALAWRARSLYPSLDLLGGVTDSFDLGESRLNVAGWLVCRENREALADSLAYDLLAATVSVFDMLDDVTLTRQAGVRGLGQMIYTFETLCPGAQVLCRLSLAPYTARLTRGCLVAAVETYLDNNPTIAGQAARGFGCVSGEWLKRPVEDGDSLLREEYEGYLAANRAMLVAGLVDGTLGTGHKILS